MLVVEAAHDSGGNRHSDGENNDRQHVHDRDADQAQPFIEVFAEVVPGGEWARIAGDDVSREAGWCWSETE